MSIKFEVLHKMGRPASFGREIGMSRVETNGKAANGISRVAEASLSPSVFIEDITIVGDIRSGGRIQIKGDVRGDIACLSAEIFAGATVEGTITAECVEIFGCMIGAVRAKMVRLHSTSRLEGDIYQESLCVDDGAYFSGMSRLLDDPKYGGLDERRGCGAGGSMEDTLRR